MHALERHFAEALRFAVDVERVVFRILGIVPGPTRVDAVGRDLQHRCVPGSRRAGEAVREQAVDAHRALGGDRIGVLDVGLDDSDRVDDPVEPRSQQRRQLVLIGLGVERHASRPGAPDRRCPRARRSVR
jgi:hypothetical protein